METVVAEKELFRACEIIFGPELTISREFLDYLQISGIKSAYRKRAMETHPDRAALENVRLRRQHHDRFHSVQEAYENLVKFLDAKEKGYCLPASASTPQPARQPSPPRADKPQRPQQPKTNQNFSEPRRQTRAETKTDTRSPFKAPHFIWDTESLYQGPLPNRRLLLGHFLYYSGLINWRTISQALIWQRTKRPRLGEIGRQFGLLSEEDVARILRNRPTLQPFGQTALELGLLTRPQLLMLVAHQKRLQTKFGEFFLEKRFLKPEELHALLKQCQEHNDSIAARLQGSTIKR